MVVALYYKVKLSVCLTKHYRMEMYGGEEVELHTFLKLVGLRDGLEGG
jgi:hypothetical protein